MDRNTILSDKTLPFYVFSLFAFWFSPILLNRCISFGDIIFCFGISSLIIYKDYRTAEIIKIVSVMSIINIFAIFYSCLTLVMDKYGEVTNVNDMYHVLVDIQHQILMKNVFIFFLSSLICLITAKKLRNNYQKVALAFFITMLLARLIRGL